jgi:hypothetical protein
MAPIRSVLPSILLSLVLASALAEASTTLKLKKSFINQYKDRATLTASFEVDKAHDNPKPAKEDGDIHIAGWSDDLGLVAVAEIMNSKKELGAVARANAVEARTKKVDITGVWRIWPEHGGDHEFTQGKMESKATNTNPDHILEIHPLTEFDGIEVADSIGKITGYKYKNADDAFHRYENTRFNLECSPSSSTVRMTMSMVGYNYTKFDLVLNEDVSHTMQDGGKAFKAAILDTDGNLMVTEERMILVPGSPAFQLLKSAKEGERYTVLGMPRVSLALVSWRCANAGDKPWVLKWDIPYEMVILAVFE